MHFLAPSTLLLSGYRFTFDTQHGRLGVDESTEYGTEVATAFPDDDLKVVEARTEDPLACSPQLQAIRDVWIEEVTCDTECNHTDTHQCCRTNYLIRLKAST